MAHIVMAYPDVCGSEMLNLPSPKRFGGRTPIRCALTAPVVLVMAYIVVAYIVVAYIAIACSVMAHPLRIGCACACPRAWHAVPCRAVQYGAVAWRAVACRGVARRDVVWRAVARRGALCRAVPCASPKLLPCWLKCLGCGAWTMHFCMRFRYLFFFEYLGACRRHADGDRRGPVSI